MDTVETEGNVNPGLKFHVWPRAYVQAAQAVVDQVFEEEALKNAYKVYTKSNDVQVTQLVKPTLRIEIQGNRLFWMLDNASVAVRGQRKDGNGEENLENRICGPLEVRIRVVRTDPFNDPIYSASVDAANLTFSSTSRGSGSGSNDFTRLSIGGNGIHFGGNGLHIGGNGINIGGNGIHFGGNGLHIGGNGINIGGNGTNERNTNISFGSSNGSDSRKRSGGEIYINDGNNISCFSSTKRSSGQGGRSSVSINGGNYSITRSGTGPDSDLGETLVSTLTKVVLDCLNVRLPDCSFPMGDNCDWMFDYRELATPRFQNGNLDSTHLGAFHCSGEPTAMPEQALPFPQPDDYGQMLTIFISNYVFNTIGCHFHENSILSYNLTQDDLVVPPTQDNLDISASRRLSDCLPDFSEKFPGATVEIYMDTIEAPTTQFSGQHLQVTILGSAIFNARLPTGDVVNFLTTEVTMETSVLLKLSMGKLTGTVTSILPSSITVEKTSLNSLNREVLREIFDLIATQFLRRKFEELVEIGIPLPRPLLPGVEAFENDVMTTADDLLRIDTNLTFHV